MRIKTALILLVIAVGAYGSGSFFENETWSSGEVDLGNGGDALFYYLFKSRQAQKTQRTLIIWLNGGPGCSSAIGMFTENGPYLFDKSLKMHYNPYSWNTYYDIVFVDQPVATVYASVKDQYHYCRNETCVANNFYKFLRNFLENHHPEYAGVPLYITGESYGGHYIPSIVAHILRANNPNINLKAAAIGNGLSDLAVQIGAYPDFVLEEKGINFVTYTLLKTMTTACKVALAYDMRIFDKFCIYTLGAIALAANIKNYYDIRRDDNDDDIDKAMTELLNRTEIQEMFHVRYREIKDVCNWTVFDYMLGDWCTPVTEDIAFALEKGIRILLYYGDKDYICNWRGGEELANSIKWHGQEGYKRQVYKPVEYKGKSYGEYKGYENFGFMRVYEAGHMVPGDQSEFALYMLKMFVENSIN